MPNSTLAAEPTTGSSALAASSAEPSAPVPPMTAAVAMMMAIDTISATMVPTMVSRRTSG